MFTVFNAVFVVTANLDPKENGKISLVAFSFIVTSNIAAAICGTCASLLLKPGKHLVCVYIKCLATWQKTLKIDPEKHSSKRQ